MMRIDCCEYASYNETNTQQRQRKKKLKKKQCNHSRYLLKKKTISRKRFDLIHELCNMYNCSNTST